ncbi:YceD family protein [Sulfuriroseicoccus oceanibius]|uniref:DUF177 domain-containing protein n=1 Tax=Sulfuriroseicoccus oceanibius TaxID=2707525 RepID=A0A6B3L4C9_9BACT|nr:hypothetical protein [Sulfuriroseicoccus oceanibius]QQL46311.1 hypothetical protein G3M56_006985 [Sulfuriroseicoccus oceanibius]
MSLNIHLDDIPVAGLHVVGETSEDIFQLADNDARPLGPLHYDLRAYNFEEVVRVEGTLEADFELECTRCLEHFPYHHRIENYSAEVETENRPTIDLTERIREDILLDLPAYPHCDAASDDRECSVGDRFTARPDDIDDAEEDASDPSSQDGPDVWSALDQWSSNDDEKSNP